MLINIILLLLIVSCSNKTLRAPSSLSCYGQSAKTCFNNYPWDKVVRKKLEFEYQYLNRQNKVKTFYNQCVLEKTINCSPSNKKQRFVMLKRNFNFQKTLSEIDNNSPIGTLKDVVNYQKWKKIYAMSKMLYQTVEKNRKKLLKSQSSSLPFYHGLGGGFSVEATLGVSVNQHNEFVIHQNKMAIFCAPAVKLKSSIGLSADISVLKTRGCQTNADYKGKFLSFEADTTIGGIGYSVGMDVSNFVEDFLQLVSQNTNFKNNLLAEIKKFKAIENFNILPVPYSNSKDEYTYHKKLIKLKGLLNKYNYNDYENLNKFVEILIQNTNNCDAVTLSLGPNLAIPFSLSIALYHYVQLTEINLKHLKEFITTPFSGNLDINHYKKIYNELEQNFKDLGYKQQINCLKNAKKQIFHDFHYLIEIFSEL